MCNVAIGKYYYTTTYSYFVLSYHIMCGGNIQICTYYYRYISNSATGMDGMKKPFHTKEGKTFRSISHKKELFFSQSDWPEKKSKWIPFALDDDGIEYKNRKRRTHISAQIFKLFGSIL